MKTVSLKLFILMISLSLNAQTKTVQLPETIISLNYDYLRSRLLDNTPKLAKDLKAEVLKYDHQKELGELYTDGNEIFSVSFHVPDAKIIANYDKDGKIVQAIERYNNVRLPAEVIKAISINYPDWDIIEDIYLVKYCCDADNLKQRYKIKIKNSDEIIDLKTDENGIFL